MYVLYHMQYQGYLAGGRWLSTWKDAQQFDKERAFSTAKSNPALIPVRVDDLKELGR